MIRHSPATGTISIFRLRTFAYPAAFRNSAACSSRETPPEEIRTRLARPVGVRPVTAIRRSFPGGTPSAFATRRPSASDIRYSHR